MKQLYLSTERETSRDRLAATLGSCAIREHYDDLLEFIEQTRLGETRIYFLRPINRIGNRMSRGTGRAVIERHADDEELGREARAILAGRGRNE